ncbi:hypothetical protein CK203_110523 [Vitis vinifera]|uniref:Uncharacterized protein n=1 Tax=Vitis vinifera TaxID=29760 RepID=A0A438D5V4_VITVI|nr:hypothetical protein CK203_110523 [Vitis vinifera]
MTMFHSGHLFHLLKLSDQPYRRQKTLTAGNFSGEVIFRHRPYHQVCKEEIFKFCQSIGGRFSSMCRPQAFLLRRPDLTRRRVNFDANNPQSKVITRALFDPNIFRSPNNENYLSWSASVELWFMSQGYEDHLVTQEADIPEVASSIVNVKQQDMDLSTYIGQIASLKEEFSTVMSLTIDVGDQRTQIDKFFMVLMLIGSVQILRTVRNQILSSSFIPSLDDVFARLLHISSTQTLPSNNTSDSSIYMGDLPALPTWPSHLILSRPQPLSSSTSQGISLTDNEYDDYLCYQATKSASVAQIGNASACLTHTSSLEPWILDSGASNHISGNKDLFSFNTTTPALPTVTLANGSQTMAKGPEYGEVDWHRTRLGHPSLSKFEKMVPRFLFLSSLACESCQLGKHTRVSFPKRLNNRAKYPFKLVHTNV